MRSQSAIALIFLISALISACSLFDLTPPGGFPEKQGLSDEYTPLAPTSEFDFHQNPQLSEADLSA